MDPMGITGITFLIDDRNRNRRFAQEPQRLNTLPLGRCTGCGWLADLRFSGERKVVTS